MEYLYIMFYNIPTGSGNGPITSDEPIESLEDVRKIESLLKKQNNETSLVVMNWKLLKESKEG